MYIYIYIYVGNIYILQLYYDFSTDLHDQTKEYHSFQPRLMIEKNTPDSI